MVDILNLALPYFGMIFIGFACGKAKGLPEQGLAWMNFFLLYVSLAALLFGIMSKTPFAELNNPPFLIATTLGTASAFVLALVAGRLVGRLSFREATLAGLAGSFGNIGYMGPGHAGRARRQGRRADRVDLLLRRHLSVYDRAAIDRVDRWQAPPLVAHTRSRGATDRFQSADHVGLRWGTGGGAPLSSAGRDRQRAVVSAKRRRADSFVCARRDGRAAPVRSRALGSARCHRSKTIDPSAHRVWIDVAHGAVPAALGGHGHPDGIAAAGAECVRDCTATRHLDRARVRRRADRDVCVRHHAHQRDVVHPDRPAGVSVK